MKVSIALATHNGEPWLREQLESLARQTLPPFELVVSDDHSSDRTLSVVETFAASAPFPVQIVRHYTRLGFADNFVSALRRCSGEAIAFCDQDDVWDASKLDLCVRAMCNNRGISLVHHDCEEVDSNLQPLGIILHPAAAGSPPRRTDEHSVVGISMLGCCMLARRSVITLLLDCWPASHLPYVRSSGSRGVLGHDLATLHLASVVGNVHYVPEVLLQHRRHDKNTWSPDLSFGKGKSHTSLAGKSKVLQECAEVRTVVASMYEEMASRAEAKNQNVAADYLGKISSRDRQLACFYARRAELYNAQLRRERLSVFRSAVCGGDYRAVGGVLDRVRCALKDLAFVIAGPTAPRTLEAICSRLNLRFHPREVAK
jgi:glycosyltransferase involved in cell wall biosynthesis